MEEILFHSFVTFIRDEGQDETDFSTLNVIGIFCVFAGSDYLCCLKVNQHMSPAKKLSREMGFHPWIIQEFCKCAFGLYIIMIYNYYPQKRENTTENNEMNYLMVSAS